MTPEERLQRVTFSAQLAERLQFDGDAPEFRAPGSLPPNGAFPAVPVRTMSLDPRIITSQLLWARKHVQDLLNQERDGVPGYTGGNQASFFDPPQDAKWDRSSEIETALCSTQGVRSQKFSLQRHLEKRFPDLLWEDLEEEEIIAKRSKTYLWTPGFSENYNPLIGALGLFSNLILKERKVQKVSKSEIRSIINFSERKFGWQLRLA